MSVPDEMPAAVTANATDIDTNDIINTTTTVFYYILYPFAKVIHILYLIALAILRPVWNTLQFISLPVTYLCSFIGYLFSLPIKLILRLETVYIFIGTAILIGLFSGAILHLISTVVSTTTGISAEDEPSTPPRKLRTVAKYRASRQKSRKGIQPGPYLGAVGSVPSPTARSSALSPKLAGRGREPLMATTILEEEDSDETMSDT